MQAERRLQLLWLVVALTLVAVLVTLLLPAIPQNTAYHQFADQRRLLGIPNFWNVVSNLPFVLVGITAMLLPVPAQRRDLAPAVRVFALALLLTGLGSGWYHLDPSNASLLWDRLPMAVGFMAFFSVVISLGLDLRLGQRLLWPLAAVGLLSVLYWYIGELGGAGDLRIYGLVQFLPMLLLPIILLGSVRQIEYLAFWWAFALYGAAKLAEAADVPLFELTGFSGHALKHLFAAAGGAVVLYGLLRPQPSRQNPGL